MGTDVRSEFNYSTALHFAELSDLAYQEEKQFKKTGPRMVPKGTCDFFRRQC